MSPAHCSSHPPLPAQGTWRNPFSPLRSCLPRIAHHSSIHSFCRTDRADTRQTDYTSEEYRQEYTAASRKCLCAECASSREDGSIPSPIPHIRGQEAGCRDTASRWYRGRSPCHFHIF